MDEETLKRLKEEAKAYVEKFKNNIEPWHDLIPKSEDPYPILPVISRADLQKFLEQNPNYSQDDLQKFLEQTRNLNK